MTGATRKFRSLNEQKESIVAYADSLTQKMQNKTTTLTTEAVHGAILDPLEGTQTLFAHLAPVPATLHHGLASDLEPASNGGESELVKFLFLGS